MEMMANVAKETSSGRTCREDASVLLGNELAQSKNESSHFSLKNVPKSVKMILFQFSFGRKKRNLLHVL